MSDTIHKISDTDLTCIANDLGVEVAVLKAVLAVETGGRGGFVAPNMPVILFEGHIFWNQLKKYGLDPNDHIAGNEDILYPKWDKKYYIGGIKEYTRLEKAASIHGEAAFCSASWGMFQIMGFNYASCGEQNVIEFVKAMEVSEKSQLQLSARYLRSTGLLPYLQKQDWAGFACKYNGSKYAQNRYDEKLRAAYLKFKSK